MITSISTEQATGLRAATGSDPTRPVLGYVHIERGHAIATDSIILAKLDLLAREGGVPENAREHPAWNISRDVLENVKGKNAELRIDLETGKLRLYTQKLGMVDLPDAENAEEVSFPPTDVFFAQPPGRLELILSHQVLEKLAKLAKMGQANSYGNYPVTLHIDPGLDKQDRPIWFRHGKNPELHGFIMPMMGSD